MKDVGEFRSGDAGKLYSGADLAVLMNCALTETLRFCIH